MVFDEPHRTEMARERAADYLRVALDGITREYPHMPYIIATGPESYRTHREFHPAFYGCFDWHSCVEMHWVVVRLLRRFPDAGPDVEARATLDALLTAEHLATEARFFGDPKHRSLERPYGWGWLLTLAYELMSWDDPDARRWSTALQPLADVLTDNFLAWLPRLTYPQRTGVHPNTAFGLSRSYDYASQLAERGDGRLRTAIGHAAEVWFAADTDYPAHYEPSGADFLSAALCEAELMSRIVEPRQLPGWLRRFLPDLSRGRPESLFQPATVSDPTDGQIAHLHGLNLSRAWAFTALAARLPTGDNRIAPMLEAAERHAEASLPLVAGSDYMVEHWLAAYATLLLT